MKKLRIKIKKNNELDKTNKTKKNLFFLLQFLFSFYLNVINLLLFFFNFYFSRLQNDKKEKKSLFFLRTLYKIWFLSLSSSFFFACFLSYIYKVYKTSVLKQKKKKTERFVINFCIYTSLSTAQQSSKIVVLLPLDYTF